MSTRKDAENAMARLEDYEPDRYSLRHWQSAYNLQLYGMWCEVRINAHSMTEKTWNHWMSKRYPKNHACLTWDRAKGSKWIIYEILPSETDF